MSDIESEKLEVKKKRVRSWGRVILSERDLDVLEFIFDMKFSSVQGVFEKFFRINLKGEEARSAEWAVRRLQQLERAGLIKGTFSFSERTKYYLGTYKGYREVVGRRPESFIVKPLGSIDHRTFAHDNHVLLARLILENKRAAHSWVSDRKLRSSKELAGGLGSSYVPDGIYIDDGGLRVGFELEMSVKSKSDYREKVKKYVSMIRGDESRRIIDRVEYVCARPSSYEFLKNELKIYGEMFKVVSFSEFFGKSPEPRKYN